MAQRGGGKDREKDRKDPKARGGTARDVELRVVARLLDAEGRDDVPKASAFAFSAGGRLLARSDVDGGKATLRIPAGKERRSVRVIVAPSRAGEEVRAAELLRQGGVERVVHAEPAARIPEVEILVPERDWLCWLKGLCLVRGKLLKRVERDGVPLDLPVCHATVEIFEVDPAPVILPRLPIPELERIRDVVLGKVPLPDPPEPLQPLPDLPFEEPVATRRLGIGGDRMFNPQPEPPAELALEASIPSELVLAARSAPAEAFRAELAGYPLVLRPILCRLFPWLVTKRKVGTATTDACGEFHDWLQLGCGNRDQPDLYFRATQRLFGFLEVTVYEPTPVSCHTWWNYECGTEVTLYTRHPWAQACDPCPAVDAPPKWVLAMAVGNTRLDRIYGTSPALQGATTPGNLGLLAGDGGPDRPFGGLCRLRLEFDSTDLRAAGIHYYRVSWRKGTSGPFAPLTGSVVRHFHKEVAGDLVLQVHPLGPQTVGGTPNLFEIPPVLPVGGGAWSHPDVVEDTTSAKFPTHTLPPYGDPGMTLEEELLAQAGKYQLQVELFHADGSPVVAGDGVEFRVPDGQDANGTVFTEDAATLGLVSGTTFVMTLHVDNNRCSAAIDPPAVGGLTADDACGVLQYDADAAPADTVTMGFAAAHPNGFAKYRFRVNRGIHNVVNESGPVPGGSVSRTIDGTFLGPCAGVTGGVAAYAEYLYVDALATNGWSNLDAYDASALRAFVLTPEPDEP